MNDTDVKCRCGGRLEYILWCSDKSDRCSHCQDHDVTCFNRCILVKCSKCGECEEKEIEE